MNAAPTPSDIGPRLEAVRARIDVAAARSSGRDPSEVRLVAVSKTKDAASIRLVYAAGQRDFGENYAQELVKKASELEDLGDLRWHFIGHLQRNKAKFVAPVASVVHTVDSARLAEELGKRAAERLPVLVEVNVGGEDQKSGCREAELAAVLDAVEKEPKLRLTGLMTVPPASDDPEAARRFFGELVKLRDAHGGPRRLPDLSMGMSHDLEEAIRAGATMKGRDGHLRSSSMTKRSAPKDVQPTLLEHAADRGALSGAPTPLADRIRPRTLDEILGQEHLLGSGRLLTEVIAADRVPSMILWGPPGSGKTTLARVISHTTKAKFVPFSAVLGGVPELREILGEARKRRAYEARGTILFVDEIHRFNKAQQDAFLPHVEDGTVTLIGATTENPSFAVNAAILSRCKVFHLEPLRDEDLVALVRHALSDSERGLGSRRLAVDDGVLLSIARAARGDARRALGLLETAVSLLPPNAARLDDVTRAAEERTLLYDKSGEEHYNVTSALIKSLRGSDADAAIYYLMRMIDAGDDPAFVLRRLVIFASEDVGNADPRALSVAVAADAAFHRLGMPEGLYPIAHACLYLATAPKSNSIGRAFSAARASLVERGALPVPKKLRNAPTPLMKHESYGEGYKYAHDYEDGYVPGETYLPDDLVGQRFYEPSNQGYEATIRERIAALRKKT